MENHIKEKKENLYGSNLQSIYSFLDVTKPSLICRLSIASTISGSMDQWALHKTTLDWLNYIYSVSTLPSVNTIIKQSFTTEDATKSDALAALRGPSMLVSLIQTKIMSFLWSWPTVALWQKGRKGCSYSGWSLFLSCGWVSVLFAIHLFLQPDYITIYGSVHWWIS